MNFSLRSPLIGQTDFPGFRASKANGRKHNHLRKFAYFIKTLKPRITWAFRLNFGSHFHPPVIFGRFFEIDRSGKSLIRIYRFSSVVEKPETNRSFNPILFRFIDNKKMNCWKNRKLIGHITSIPRNYAPRNYATYNPIWIVEKKIILKKKRRERIKFVLWKLRFIRFDSI